MDAGAIMQDDTSIGNLKVLTQVCHEHGLSGTSSTPPPVPNPTPPAQLPAALEDRQRLQGMAGRPLPYVRPGVCFPWEAKAKELPPLTGDPDLVRRVWENIDAFGNVYIWQLLLSF
ncbi:MAG: hypothetical protein FJ387_07325 [Verrucomicrobia bacterium]|nr:hypothetical protein [Verrucomicrobiota bacterium]